MSLGALYLLEEGQTDRAIAWSDRALKLFPNDMSSLGNGWGHRDWVERDPDYESLRGDPRFQRLVTTFK